MARGACGLAHDLAYGQQGGVGERGLIVRDGTSGMLPRDQFLRGLGWVGVWGGDWG